MTLTEFLLARIAEDEAIAKAAARTGGMSWEADRYRVVVDGEFEVVEGNVKSAAHIARHDPARLLVECKAKRQLVDILGPATDRDGRVIGGGVTDALHALALPYADHPDYDEAWRP